MTTTRGLLKIADSIGLGLSFCLLFACGSSEETLSLLKKGKLEISQEVVSSGSEACRELFRTEVHPLVMAECRYCHFEGGLAPRSFAVPDSNTSYNRLREKIMPFTNIEGSVAYTNATTNGHGGGCPNCGPSMTAAFQPAFQAWGALESDGCGSKEKTGTPSNDIANTLTEKSLFISNGQSKILTWNLNTSTNPIFSSGGASFSIRVTAVTTAGNISYDLQDPKLTTGSVGVDIKGILFSINGILKQTEATAFNLVDATVTAFQTDSLLQQDTAILTAQNFSTDKIGIHLSHLGIAGSNGGGGGPLATPVPTISPTPNPTPGAGVSFTSLTAPGGIFQANCLECHTGATARRGYDMSTYNGILQLINPANPANRGIMWDRMTDALDPMPPEAQGGNLQPTDLITIKGWIDAGAPQ